MEPRVNVLHFLLAREARLDESWRPRGLNQFGPYVLRGLSYLYRVDPDTEFPKDARPPGAVYLRVQGNFAGFTSLLLRVHHRNGRGEWREITFIPSRTANPIAFSDTEIEVHDLIVNLPYLRFGGVGLHAMSLHFCRSDDIPDSRPDREVNMIHPWSDDTDELFAEPGWEFGSVDYFWVERDQ